MERVKKIIERFLTKTLVPFWALFPAIIRDTLKFITEKMYLGALAAKHYHPLLTTQRIGPVEFKLWIQGGHVSAQKTYGDLEKTKGVYEELMVRCVTDALDGFPGGEAVFVDVGAFMGYYACYVARYLKDRVPVYAVESNPDYCETVRRSVQENGFKNLQVFDAVLSDKEEVLHVLKETVSYEDAAGGKELATITMDQLCAREHIHPTILKVDVHGAEGKVLGGSRAILNDSVRCVLFEVHPDDYLEKYSAGYTRRDVLGILEECGFKNYLIGGFRYDRSPERKLFLETGRIHHILITEDNKDLLFFDRHSDLFIFSVRDFDLEQCRCFKTE
jgi:FkbM family methyltransferase